MTMTAQEMRERLEAAGRYPRVTRTEMDNGIFYFSLDYIGLGQFVTWEGVVYAVQYGWIWMSFTNGLNIYGAELEPV